MKDLILETLKDKGLWKAVLACVVVSAVFGLYVVFIGHPMTKSKSLVNLAIEAEQSGDTQKAQRLLNEASDLWHTPEIDQLRR